MSSSPYSGAAGGESHPAEPSCPRCGERLDRQRRPWLVRWLDAWHGEDRPYYRCRSAHCVWKGQLSGRHRR